MIDKIKDLYYKYKFLTWPLLSAVCSLAVLILVVVPQLTKYLSDQGKLDLLRNQTSVLEAKAQELNRIDKSETQKNLQVVFTVLPQDPDPPSAMAVLQDQVNKSGLSLKGSSFVGGNKAGSQGSYQINISVVGPITAVRQFLINLQSAPLIYQVDSIGVHFQSGGTNIEAQIPISVYYQSPQNPKLSVDQEVPKLNSQEQKLLSKLSQLVPEALASEVAVGNQVTQSNLPNVPLGKADPFQ